MNFHFAAASLIKKSTTLFESFGKSPFSCPSSGAELACSLDNLLPSLSLRALSAIPHDEMNYTVYCQSALIILASAKMTEHCSGPQTKETHLRYNGPRISLSELH